MENLSGALKHVSHALDLDCSGFRCAAFTEYIQSLQLLIFCISNLFSSSGFKKMVENKKEVMQVLNMIHECSDRISVILNEHGNPVKRPIIPHHKTTSELSVSKMSVFENLQRENRQLFKLYKMRLERAKDKNTKTNLALEFQRGLTENAILAKNKYEMAAKQLQKERVQLMENAIRKLFENTEHCSEKEKEKRQLYEKVLQYVKTEEWPSSWQLNPYDLTVLEITGKLFHKIIRCCDHPLTQWLILIQTNIKRKMDNILKEFAEYTDFFPDLKSESKLYYCVEENDEKIIFKRVESTAVLSSSKMLFLEDTLKAVSSEIRTVIEDTLEIFYLTYKSLLPEDSEVICYQIIEQYFLKPLWLNLSTLFRILNLSTEYKIYENMQLHKNCTPSDFGIFNNMNFSDEFYKNVVTVLETALLHQSLVNKLRILVQVTQKVCNCDTNQENAQKNLGIDEMIPVLCYIIVKSEISQLVSECDMLEHLFDMRYMLGQEGYALSSFHLALKCIEIKNLSDTFNPEEKV